MRDFDNDGGVEVMVDWSQFLKFRTATAARRSRRAAAAASRRFLDMRGRVLDGAHGGSWGQAVDARAVGCA
eukprot:1844743-Pyramimonas_sp.AAC.1